MIYSYVLVTLGVGSVQGWAVSLEKKTMFCLYGDGICDGPLSQIIKVTKVIFYIAEAK